MRELSNTRGGSRATFLPFAYPVLLWLLIAAPAAAQAPQPIKLTLRPQAAPTPAWKYLLLPDLHEQTPGNALVLYYRAYSPELLGYRRDPEIHKKIEKWLATPLKDLPRQEMQWIEHAGFLKELDLGARREHCDWEMTDRLRKEGITMLLPDIQGFREMANLLALRARLEMADGNFDKATRTLQTGYALARHLGEAPLLIPSLVGIAIASVMSGEVEKLIQEPGAPNLYWALTALPRPLVELRKPLLGERLILSSILSDLPRLEAGPVSKEQLQEQVDKAMGIMSNMGTGFDHQGYEQKLGLAFLVAKFYPQAKQHLLAKGRKPEEVDAMPTLQVVILYSVDQYRRLQDDLYKWTTVPYWQGVRGLHQAERQIALARGSEEGLPFASMLLPAIAKVYFAQVRTDRRIAALRCVEAIRLYAAAHDGRLPERLSDITEVPLPIDPLTGKEFEYRTSGAQATLYGPAPAGEVAAPHNTINYELTLQR
jgi:hypothetical protein